jgi:hypothetical protein
VSFLNVDLDLEAAHDLSAVAAALEANGMFRLHCGPTDTGHRASFELERDPTTADDAIRELARAVRSLPREALDGVRVDLAVGIEAGDDRLEVPLSSEALSAAAGLGARITLVVYPRGG